MGETFAGMVAEVERAVRPLGFRIEEADRRDRKLLIGEMAKEDDGSIRITIVRKGSVG